jgi:iron(III) transport system permease protein
MKYYLSSFRKYYSILYKRWLLFSFFFSVCISIPLLVLVKGSFTLEGFPWQHVKENLLFDYILNSGVMLLVVGIFTTSIALVTAWLVAEYKFFGSQFFVWSLMLPLAFPSYIMAHSYAGIFSFTGPIFNFVSNTFGNDFAIKYYFDVKNKWVLFSILSLVLYPYIFIPLKSAFSYLGSNYTQAAQSLSINKFKIFFKIKLPLLRPVIFGGLFLVMMELLNDYGAVKYFGYNTLTVGIFKVWFSFGELSTAIRLASILALFVFILMAAERLMRNKKRFNIAKNSKPLVKIQLKGLKNLLAFSICSIPLFFGFLLPFLYNFFNATSNFSKVVNKNFLAMLGNTFLMAFIASFVIVFISIIIFYGTSINKYKVTKITSRIAVIGYAIPGAVIAVGVLFFGGWLDNFLIDYHFMIKPIFSGSFFLILFAYSTRFLAVSYQPIEAGFQQLQNGINESSRSLGMSPFATFIKVNIPVLKKVFLGAFLLVFIDVLKELPLTLILRPFNFETLATKTFELANDEQMGAASVPAFIIVFLGLISVYLLNRIFKK